MNVDDYLQNPIMRRFLKEHKLDFAQTRADYIAAIEAFANENEDNENITKEWLLKVVKEGSKEICYRKIRRFEDWHRDPVMIEAKVKEKFPNCPQESILTYENTGERKMIEYHIITNGNGEVIKLEFTFSKLFSCDDTGANGRIAFPVFIEVYLEKGFIISRGKAKSTLYTHDGDLKKKVDTMEYAALAMDFIAKVFDFDVEENIKVAKNKNSQMLYKIYSKYSFTPEDVKKKVQSQDVLIKEFVNQIFSNLNLDVRNKRTAITDIEIFVEKFISINGDDEEVFKKDRLAWLTKVTADDEMKLTKIDTTSTRSTPLQCTPAFFDSKKSVINSKKCKRLNLVFKRANETYFSKYNELVVQFGMHKNYGYVKTMQYAEEVDIQNVLQAVFDNY